MPNINIELCFSLSAAQTMGPRPSTAAAAASAPPVRGVPQYKYTPNVRSPQQHMNTQPQVTMQQVRLLHLYPITPESRGVRYWQKSQNFLGFYG